MTVVMYGIPNCDTIKKARTWLAAQGIAYRFHDYKAEGVDAVRLETWCDALGWEKVLNKGSTTFQGLPPEAKSGLDKGRAIELMIAQPSMIKRPILDVEGRFTAGFKPEVYQKMFGV